MSILEILRLGAGSEAQREAINAAILAKQTELDTLWALSENLFPEDRAGGDGGGATASHLSPRSRPSRQRMATRERRASVWTRGASKSATCCGMAPSAAATWSARSEPQAAP